MSYGENPGDVISITSTETFDQNADFGHASAGQDLCLAFDGGLAANDEVILGKFLDLDVKQEASVMITGQPMILRQSAKGACTVGSKVVGAGNGQVKNGTAANGRGRVLEVLEDDANGRVKVLMPE